MPKFPLAPGHKGVLLIPLYIVAGELTISRWGSTLTGITTGTVAFLFGQGRFGIFEIFKYITAGLAVDFGLPIIKKASPRPSVFIYSILGLIVAIARFSTVVLVAYLIGAPAGFYAVLAPFGVIHCIFGILSGFISFYLLRSIDILKNFT